MTATSTAQFVELYASARARLGIGGRTLRLRSLFERIGHARSERRSIRAVDADDGAADRVAKFISRLGELRQLAAGDHFLNVWSVAGLGRLEVRTAAVLSWCLDHQGTHGVGSSVLDALLCHVGEAGNLARTAPLRLGDYRVLREHCSFGELDNRVDIAIEGENCVVFIEVKIDAGEGRDQLIRYEATATRKAKAMRREHVLLLYLSERQPVDARANVVSLRWRDVATAIRRAIGPRPSTLGRQILSQFAVHVDQLHG